MELRIHPKKWECNPGLWEAFIIRPLTPVTFGVAFPQTLTEIGRELGVCIDVQHIFIYVAIMT